jgi:hypothetical protein
MHNIPEKCTKNKERYIEMDTVLAHVKQVVVFSLAQGDLVFNMDPDIFHVDVIEVRSALSGYIEHKAIITQNVDEITVLKKEEA